MPKKTLSSILIALVLITASIFPLLRPPTDASAQVIIGTLPVITLPPNATATRTPNPINIGNFVWDDLDQDGRQDAGEPGIPGVIVQLWNSNKTQMLDSAVTNASGNYTVTAPMFGSYRVRVVLPTFLDGFAPKDQAGGDDMLDSDINPTGPDIGFTDIFTLGSNVISIINIDAGIILFRTPTPTRTPTPINIGNFVWHDLNGNGIQNAGEPGVGGITVQLWNANKTQLIASTVTNSSGNYTVVAPLPGDYRIRVVPFAGSTFSPKDQGSNTEDSDINPSGPDLGFTDVFNIASNVISISNLDAGLTVVAPSPTPTNTRTPTPGPSPTPSPTPSPQPDYDFSVFLPMIMRSE